MNEKNTITKTAMITVCGRPNVGKSSLTNALVRSEEHTSELQSH